jgi:outer membrane protein OmpA-like peptidoglycan-associated protein
MMSIESPRTSRRMIVVVLVLVSLLVLAVYTHYAYYHAVLKPQLQLEIDQYLKDQGFKDVRAEIHYLDATLKGSVHNHEDIAKIYKAIDDMPGVRVPEENNRIEVGGWLVFNSDAHGVVTIAGMMDKDDYTFPQLRAHEQQLATDRYVVPPSVLDNKERGALFMQFVRDRLDTPNTEIRLHQQQLYLKTRGTIYQEKEWRDYLKRFRLTLHATLEYYPSALHFPDYEPQSPISGTRFKAVREQLKKLPVLFEFAALDFSKEEEKKIDAIAKIIRSTPKATFVIGGHISEEGSLKLSNEIAIERGKRVYWSLLRRGIHPEQLTMTKFGTADSKHQTLPLNSVEVLIK